MITRRTMLSATALTGAALAVGTGSAVAGRPIGNELSRFVTDLAERGLFAGTVLLDYRGHTVMAAAHGLADRASGTTNTMATRFTAASVGKFFTAVTAARFVQNGRLSFGTTFGDAVPTLRNPALRPLTLHQLLTHTAALPQVPPGLPPGTLDTGRASDYLPMLERLQLLGTPGHNWQYSNAGYLAAAIMIEQVARCRFDTAVRGHVFVPAGMRHSIALRPAQRGVPVAVRYSPSGETFPPDSASGAGGFYTTAGDLVAFGRALLRRRLLDEVRTTEVITGKVPTGHGDVYAYGCSVSVDAGHQIVWHNGGGPGANAWLQLYPSDGYVLAALSNVFLPGAGGGVQPIVDRAQRLIVGT